MPRLREKLAAGRFVASLEITPPKKRLDEVLLRRARFAGRVDALHVIQRPDRLSSLDASLLLAQAGLEPVWHLLNRGRTEAEIRSEIASAREGGLRAVLCLRGDHEAPDVPDGPRIRDVVALVREGLPDAVVGATANQYGPRERVLANLLPKIEAGARFVQTNPVLDVDVYRTLAEALRRRAPAVRLLPMVMPLVSRAGAERIAGRLGVPVPQSLLSRLAAGGEAAGWAAFDETVRVLAREGLGDGVAVMTPVMDPEPPFGERIAAVLAGVRSDVEGRD